jgi:Tfp pilus assembly protein PilN
MRTAINLLPQSFRRQQVLRRRAVQWSTIISAVLVMGWGWHWFEMREDRQLLQQFETLTHEHAPTQAMLKQLVEMRQQLKELEQQETVAKELDCQRNTLTLFGVVSDTARKTKGRLRVTKFELSNFQNTQGPTDNAAAKPPGLIINGVSLDNPAVGELLDGLQKSGIFKRVELLSLKEREDKDAALRDYEVQCEF